MRETLMSLKTGAFYFSFALVGAVIGLGSWYFQFSDFKAVKIIALDRIDIPGVPTQYVIDPIILVETIKSQGFANKIAKRTGLPDLARILPAAVYGGQQALNVRNLSGNPLTAIELRLKMPTAEMARKAMDAVADEIGLMQSNKTQAFLDALSQPTPPKVRLAGESSPLAIGNEQATLYQFALNRALIEAAIRTRTGQSVETSVLPPTGQSFFMALGSVGMLCAAFLVRMFGTSLIRVFDADSEPSVRESSQASSGSGQEPMPSRNPQALTPAPETVPST
jgi:hypothetical protein